MHSSPLRRTAVRVSRALSVLLALVVVFGVSPPGPAQAAGPPRVLPQLLGEAGARPEQTFRVLIGRRGGDRRADQHVAGKGGAKRRDVATVGFVAEVKGKDIAELGRHPAVQWVTPDAPMVQHAATTTSTAPVSSSKLATVFNQTLGTPALWSAGVDGRGVGVAVVDTGIYPGHTDFWNEAYRTRVVAQATFNANSTTTDDKYGHGSYVAGLVAGNSWHAKYKIEQGLYVGVAPRANLVNVKVSDDAGVAYLSDVIDGIEWVIANRKAYNIRVLNLSLTSSVAESAATSYLAAAVERAWFSGILVVVAAGNVGPNTALYPPANDPFVITVGASDAKSTTTRGDDGMAPWSSYGTTQDGYAKPDVVAPGRHDVSSLAYRTPVFQTLFASRVTVDKGHLWLSGTSASAPMVAGVAALAFQKHPEWTNDAVKWLLMSTSTRLGATDPATGAFVPLPGQGSGLVSAAAVVNYAGTPGLANVGVAISRRLLGPNGATTYTGQGPSNAAWVEGGWDHAWWTEGGWDAAAWTEGGWDAAAWTEGGWDAGAPTLSPWAYTGVE